MKNNITLSIPKPCSQSWSGFMLTQEGAFCSTCSKTVVDFTKMSQDEILTFFKNTTTDTCGRFRSDQLKMYSHQEVLRINPGLKLLRAGLLSLLVLAVGQPIFAIDPSKPTTELGQRMEMDRIERNAFILDQLVKGIVISDEDNQPLPGVNIYLKGSEVGTTTDADGKFEFPRKLKEGDVIVFSFIGLATQEYTVTKESLATLQIRMTYDTTLILGEVAVDGIYSPEPTGMTKWWKKVKAKF